MKRKLKIYIPSVKFPPQDRGVSPPTSLPTSSPRGNFSGEKFHQSSYLFTENSRSIGASVFKWHFRRKFAFNSTLRAQARKNSVENGKISSEAHFMESRVKKHVGTHLRTFSGLKTFDQPLPEQMLLGGSALCNPPFWEVV